APICNRSRQSEFPENQYITQKNFLLIERSEDRQAKSKPLQRIASPIYLPYLRLPFLGITHKRFPWQKRKTVKRNFGLVPRMQPPGFAKKRSEWRRRGKQLKRSAITWAT